MGPQFSKYELQQLTPLLGSMAQMVSRGSPLGENEIKPLLMNTGMANNPIVLNELKLWGRLLKYLHEQPLPELRAATIATLVSRHVPEAEVLSAVDIVLSSSIAKPVVVPQFAEVEPHKSDPPGVIDAVLAASMAPNSPHPHTQPLRVNPSTLDFGVLTTTQPAIREFEVQGGPGKIVVDSEQLRVEPLRFGVEPVRVTVEVKPRNDSLLKTSLKLVTSKETVELPVQAQWKTPSPRQQPAKPTPEVDLAKMVEEAMGLSPTPGNVQTSNKQTDKAQQKQSLDANTEILRQLHDLLG